MAEKLWCKISADEWDKLLEEKLDIKKKHLLGSFLTIEDEENWFKRIDEIDLQLEKDCKIVIDKTKIELNTFRFWKTLKDGGGGIEDRSFIIDWIEQYITGKKINIKDFSNNDKEVFSKFLKNEGDNNIEFTKEFISKNMLTFIKNINNYLIFLLNIESSWGKLYLENTDSSAKSLFQIIDGWKNWEKHSDYNRKKWLYTPFETMLRRADKYYNDWKFENFKSEKTPQYIKDAWNNDWKLDLWEDTWISVDKLINLLMMDILMRNWKDDSEAKTYFMWMILWWEDSRDKLYSKIHHTNVDKKTEEVMKQASLGLKSVNW